MKNFLKKFRDGTVEHKNFLLFCFLNNALFADKKYQKLSGIPIRPSPLKRPQWGAGGGCDFSSVNPVSIVL